jgi:hypothetical protein
VKYPSQVALLLSLFGGTVALLRSGSKAIMNPLQVRKVPKSKSKAFMDFVEAYQGAFGEAERVSTAEMIRWSDGVYADRHMMYQNDVIYHRKQVVGLCNTIFFKDIGLIYIGHFAVLQSIGTYAEQSMIYRRCFSRARKRSSGWKYAVFEIDNITNEDGSPNKQSIARLRRFQAQARLIGHEIRLVEFPYKYPTFQSDFDQRGGNYAHLAIICKDKGKNAIEKVELANILKAIYARIYAKCIGGSASAETAFRHETAGIMEKFEFDCPDPVRLMHI